MAVRLELDDDDFERIFPTDTVLNGVRTRRVKPTITTRADDSYIDRREELEEWHRAAVLETARAGLSDAEFYDLLKPIDAVYSRRLIRNSTKT